MINKLYHYYIKPVRKFLAAALLLMLSGMVTAQVAINDTLATQEDVLLNGDVATNDTVANNPTAQFTLATQAAFGSVVLNTNGTFSYTPNADFFGSDSYTYSLCDGGAPAVCDTATVYVTVTPVNDAPVATNDNATTVQAMDVTGNVSTNDTDIDGPSATYTVLDNPNNGTLVLATNGQYIYNPNPAFTGCDTAVLLVCDGGTPERCDTSLLIVCVTAGNQPPVAQNDNLTSPEDAILLINVLANDIDPEGQLNNPVVLTSPVHGTAVVNNDGTITYTPDSNYFGTDSFTYVVCDGGTPALCDTATVVLTITSVQDSIIINVQPLVTDEDVTGTGCFSYELAGAQDSVLVAVVCSPEHGVADSVTAANGQICVVYTPDREYNGEDSLCIELCDLAGGGCTRVTVYITINPLVDNCLWLKGISPNGDGQNDSFWINCNSDYPNATLRIFNRWGDEVYRSNGHYNNDWYGRNQTEKELTDGTYYYIYDYGDGVKKAHAGFVTINR